jgi:heme exporter protein D
VSWASPAEFFAMGGYAFYVWGSYGLATVLIVAELWFLVTRRRTLLDQSRRSLDMANDAE